MPMARFSDIRAGYVYLPVDGTEYRIYYEESGSGIPVLLQHTASADGRQWRHILEDRELTRRFRFIAYDLPYHGKSLPPAALRWWESDYILTKDFFEKCILAVADGFELDRPVFMGCSMGGNVAVDLAVDYPARFRAVVAIAGAMLTRPPGHLKMIDWYRHPRMSNSWKPALMYTMMSPTSPEPLKRETTFVYSQGAPMVFRGDLTYHTHEHDARETARTIDTSKLPVFILSGEYDWSGTPAACSALAREVKGSYYREMSGLGHFPMSEDPERFKQHLLPILDEIAALKIG
jgi:pimeloyl-ACP methyl ester carboxylesterase